MIPHAGNASQGSSNFTQMEKTMRKTQALALTLIAAVMIPAVQQIHAASKSIDGIISDTMCGKKHMIPGKTDAECVQECVKSGSSYALVAGDKVYTLTTKPETISRFAGKHVHIEGKLKDKTITVNSIIEMPHIMKM
jgi:hypothetical protein